MNDNILIVDDCDDNLFILDATIRAVYPEKKTLKASGGKEAFDIFVKNTIDILIVDYNMPEWDGLHTLNNMSYYLLEKIGKSLKESSIKYYIFTACMLDSLKLHDGSSMDIIEKPINRQKIKYMIG